jgi:hypothetical protein
VLGWIYISDKGIYKVYDPFNARDIIFDEKKFFMPQHLLISAKKVPLLLRQDDDEEPIVFISCNSSTHIPPGQPSHISPPSASPSTSSHPSPHPSPIIYDEIVVMLGPLSPILLKAVTSATEGDGHPFDEELEEMLVRSETRRAALPIREPHRSNCQVQLPMQFGSMIKYTYISTTN